MRSLRSAAGDSELAAKSDKRTSLRNLRFNVFLLLFRFCFLPSSDRSLLVGQQCDERSDHEDDAADPDPHRQRVVKDLDDGLLSIGSRAGEYNVNVVLCRGIDRHFARGLWFRAGFVDT